MARVIVPYKQKKLRESSDSAFRLVTAQGLATFPVEDASVEALKVAFEDSDNSILQAFLQRAAANWLEEVNTDFSTILPSSVAALQAISNDTVSLRVDDFKSLAAPHDEEGMKRTYEVALMQGDTRWTSAVGAILLLSAAQDVEAFDDIVAIANQSKHPQIKAAYEQARPLIVAKSTVV